jgi:hypothetical protein
MDEIKTCPNCGNIFAKEQFKKEIDDHENQFSHYKTDGRRDQRNYVDKRWNRKKFCCQSCTDEFYAEKYCREHRKEKIKTFFQSDKQECARCGYSGTIDIHHIIYKKEGGQDSPENLIPLCPNCHALIHRKLISIDEILKLKMIEVSP